MTNSLTKIAYRTGLITAAVLLLYQTSDLLFHYHHFRFEYYLTGAAGLAKTMDDRRTDVASFGGANCAGYSYCIGDKLIHKNKKVVSYA